MEIKTVSTDKIQLERVAFEVSVVIPEGEFPTDQEVINVAYRADLPEGLLNSTAEMVAKHVGHVFNGVCTVVFKFEQEIQ